MTYRPYDEPRIERMGWRADWRARFYGAPGGCNRCGHPLEREHFYWTNGTDTEIGCTLCPDYICDNRLQEVTQMSAINLCERCDALMIGSAVAHVEIKTGPREEYQRMEICPPCVGDLMAWQAEKPQRDKQVYRSPWKPSEQPSAARLALEAAGYCGAVYEVDGAPKYMCLRTPGHVGLHEDGAQTWE